MNRLHVIIVTRNFFSNHIRSTKYYGDVLKNDKEINEVCLTQENHAKHPSDKPPFLFGLNVVCRMYMPCYKGSASLYCICCVSLNTTKLRNL